MKKLSIEETQNVLEKISHFPRQLNPIRIALSELKIGEFISFDGLEWAKYSNLPPATKLSNWATRMGMKISVRSQKEENGIYNYYLIRIQ